MNLKEFERRKHEHIALSLDPRHQSDDSTGLETIYLPHSALPELDLCDVILSHKRFGETVSTPFFISSMTAGHDHAEQINTTLAKACEQTGWAMGVGSQRRELSDANAGNEWRAIRKNFPKAKLFANLGISQLIQTDNTKVLKIADNLHAQAIIIHCNPLQECLQPEGTPQFRGGLDAIASLCHDSSLPVIVKETGCGFSHETLKQLKHLPVAAVDISGKGGTHWGRIEGSRSSDDSLLSRVSQTFANWGNTTLQGVLQGCALKPKYEIWGSGGVRSGLDAAKLLALGASSIGIAKPMLQPALDGVDAVINEMQRFEYELKLALFCTGSDSIQTLQRRKLWRHVK